MNFRIAIFALASTFLDSTCWAAMTEEKAYYKGTITVKNNAPENGTCQTPVWVGIHTGTFDLYDRDAPIPAFMESFVEDGNSGPLRREFKISEGSLWDGMVGSGPLCPGDEAMLDFTVPVMKGKPLYLSYSSMILPSNDAFVANGDPTANPIFDSAGNFVQVMIDDSGSDVLDAGTEVNDELAANTAFFGQATPNTGVVENAVVTTHPGFNPVGSGGILDAATYSNANFKVDGYKTLSVTVTSVKKLMTKSGRISVINKAPEEGTCLTPVWAGIHMGSFDLYDRDVPIPEFMESFVEDGNAGPLRMAFMQAEGTVWDGMVGSAPLCPGGMAELMYEFGYDEEEPKSLFFSYASMILPSNDAFVANGDPMANKLYDDYGHVKDVLINDLGSDILDAGTEENDELPENTAFFGQSTPNTGIDENSVVMAHPGYKPAENEGILDDPMFANADFTADGYKVLEIKVEPFEGPFNLTPRRHRGDSCVSVRRQSLRAGSSLRIMPCDSSATTQRFIFQDNMFHLEGDENKCLQAGLNGPAADGEYLRVIECDPNNDIQKFDWKAMGSPISLTYQSNLCVTNAGVTINYGDLMILKECDVLDSDRADYLFL